MKTLELTGAALDWAVSTCLTGGELYQSGRIAHAVVLHSVGGTVAPYFVKDSGVVRCAFEPSTNWAQGGPIIEREEIGTERRAPCMRGEEWEARGSRTAKGAGYRWAYGPTPLVAAMRCFVQSRLGDEVEVPDALL